MATIQNVTYSTYLACSIVDVKPGHQELIGQVVVVNMSQVALIQLLGNDTFRLELSNGLQIDIKPLYHAI